MESQSMSDRTQPLTLERLRSVLSYDAATGVLRWKVSPAPSVPVGRVAGHLGKGRYIRVSIDGVRYQAHRLAWFYVYGEWPASQLDHREADSPCNSLINLRPATASQNASNRRRPANNTTGFKGVTFVPGRRRWQAAVKKNGKAHFLGYFRSPEESHAAYVAKARELFGEFARAA